MAHLSSFVFTQPGPLRLYSTAELLKLPPPTYLVERAVPDGGLVGLYGPPGHGKSFVAVDLAMCVGTGQPWFGRKVEEGFALYISAEGGMGIGIRVAAWLHHRKVAPSRANVAWLTESITVQEETASMERLFDRIQHEVEEHPSLIVIDTLARCFEGNENAQEDMGRFIKGADLMRREFKAAVVVVHHTREDGNRERGSTAFRGAADAMITVRKDTEGQVLIGCDKQKDAEEFDEITCTLRPSDAVDSCVLVMSSLEAASALEQVLQRAGADGVSYSAIEREVTAQGVSRSTLKRRLRALLISGSVIRHEGIYRWRG